MQSNLDIWAVQSDPEEVITALDNIKTDNDIILYTNVICNFKIGNDNITSRQFDTFLYSEENDILVLLMRGGKASAADIREYLDNKHLKYNEIVFAPSIRGYEDEYNGPEIWFAREKYVLEDAIKDSIEKSSKKECEFYPFLPANLDLGYLTNSKSDNYSVEGRLFRGVVKFEDKIILLVSQNDTRNVTASEVNEVLKEYGIECVVLDNSDFDLSKSLKSSKSL